MFWGLPSISSQAPGFPFLYQSQNLREFYVTWLLGPHRKPEYLLLALGALFPPSCGGWLLISQPQAPQEAFLSKVCPPPGRSLPPSLLFCGSLVSEHLSQLVISFCYLVLLFFFKSLLP